MFNEKNRAYFCEAEIARLKEQIYTKVCDLKMTAYCTREPTSFEERANGDVREITVGDSWGQLFDCAWFHMQASLPESVKGKNIVLVLDINGEGLVYDKDGHPFRAITNINSDFDRNFGVPGKRIVPFCDNADGNETVDLWMDAGCNDLFGNLRENGCLKEAYVAVCNGELRQAYYDLEILMRLFRITPETEPRHYELLDILWRALSFNSDDLSERIRHIKDCVSPYYEKETGDQSLKLIATGHAHLDLAWLWPLRETHRKAARTYATALDLMERYPEYIFGASQAQSYDWIKNEHPDLYERIKERVREGRWELQGAMWVESDTNITGGESLIRQFLYGNRFWEKEFGKTVNFVWLPDVFGYTAALPQIIRGFGLPYFSTIKLSWNEHNRFPYSTFRWKGLDGSSVLVHMPPEGCYLSEASPKGINDCSRSMAKSGQFGTALLPFGIGDGGGGPSPYHLEFLRREKHLPGLPAVEQGTIKEFFNRIDSDAEYPSWYGELYLEKHQGTYTTAARNKRYNRKIELLLRDTEFINAVAMRMAGAVYPQEKLEEIWKEALLYQFHDILPGSSIDRVYEESEARYKVMLQEVSALRDQGLTSLTNAINTDGMNKPIVLFNTLSFPRHQVIPVEGGAAEVIIPSMGYTVVDISALTPTVSLPEFDLTKRIMENEYIRVMFGEDGSIVSLYDKRRNREMLKAPSNRYLFYTETGDAWDFSADYRSLPVSQAKCVSFEMLREGAGVICRQKYIYKRTTLEVSLVLQADSPQLRVDCKADWQKDNAMLRVQFLPDIRFDNVDCDIQFGHISRSAVSNTTRDLAQFEICAHKWIAADEGNIGFALLNDCKYGYFAKDGVLEINCLRSTFHPAKEVDRGLQEFSYALLPTGGVSERLQTIHQAYSFNVPVISVPTKPHSGYLAKEHSFFSCSSENVIIETVKKAEDTDDIVVRSYETLGGQTANILNCGVEYSQLVPCNLYECKQQDDIENIYEPFSIHTVLVSSEKRD